MKDQQTGKPSKYQLAEHPWVALLLTIVTGIPLIIVVGSVISTIGIPEDNLLRPLIQPTLAHILTLFVIAPFVMRIPNGKRSFGQYLDDIRLSRVRPFLPLLLLGISCAAIWLLSSTAGSIIYRLSQGLPLTSSFLRRVIDIRASLPPRSMSFIAAFPCIFEDVLWRGVMFALFRKRYSERQTVLITALGFGLMHLFNLVSGYEPLWPIGQAVWGSALGLFYGYLILRTESLMPCMVFHYLCNTFIGSFSVYLQRTALLETLVWYSVVYTVCAVPLMIWWVRFYSSRWLTPRRSESITRAVISTQAGPTS